ncbi:MAG TPA: hypothetical protein VMU59_07625 [Caulobacteraceae bacterium]|nr:hypothetical protein [Caulobacteraceae bacterium]
MAEHVYLDDRDQDVVIRAMEADIKALVALSSALLRTLAATSPAVARAVEDEARHAAKSDPLTARHVQSVLYGLSGRLTPTRGPVLDVGDLEWTPSEPAAKG